MPDRDYYADLGLTQYATGSQIRSAFHTLAKQHHPDKSGDVDASAFRVAREAYEKLSDATFKAEYDRNYCYMRMQSDTDGLTGTRTAAYEAEEAAREYDDDRATAAAYEEMLRRSPPPKKPARKFNESGASYFLGKAYTAWEKRDAAYRQKHPAYGQA
jgi:DnaJ-class molecular chaperone